MDARKGLALAISYGNNGLPQVPAHFHDAPIGRPGCLAVRGRIGKHPHPGWKANTSLVLVSNVRDKGWRKGYFFVGALIT